MQVRCAGLSGDTEDRARPHRATNTRHATDGAAGAAAFAGDTDAVGVGCTSHRSARRRRRQRTVSAARSASARGSVSETTVVVPYVLNV